MAEKIGEGNVIEPFSEILTSMILQKNPNSKIIKSNMSGKSDRVFADYFASFDANNILIEFKEFDSEIKYEKDKFLRKKLCEQIKPFVIESMNGHHVAWRENIAGIIKITLDNYIYQVCPLFNIKTTAYSSEKQVSDFITDFIEGKIGLKLYTFKRYIEFLERLKDDSNSGKGFHAVLYSYSSGILISTPIENNYMELITLIEQEKKHDKRFDTIDTENIIDTTKNIFFDNKNNQSGPSHNNGGMSM